MFSDNDLLIFDTSALLDLYRHPIIASKRILECLRENNNRIWIPAQVKVEYNKNVKNVKNVDMYKKFNKDSKKEAKRLEKQLLNYINNYSKSKFSSLSLLETDINKNFANIFTAIDKYSESLKPEEEVYKNFVLDEVDAYLNELLSGDKSGKETNIVELINILKEGELRYKYKIAPGYKDAEKKSGIDKFGDLIVWKQIIEKAKSSKENRIFFITSDNKPDWFTSYNVVRREPCKELIEEFNYYIKDKEIVIITMSDFIKSLSSESEESDSEILLELRKDIVVNSLKETINEVIGEFIDDKGVDFLDDIPEIPRELEVRDIYVIRNEICNTNVTLDDKIATYEIDVQLEIEYYLEDEDQYSRSEGYVKLEGTIKLEVERALEINEDDFIKSVNTINIIVSEGITIENYEYYLDDVDIEEDGRAEQMDVLEEYYKH